MEESNTSGIESFFDGSNILLTGVNEFVGSLLLENILRKLPTIRQVYVLTENENCNDFIQKISGNPIFDNLKRKIPNFLRKVACINGSCASEKLGLSQNDKEIIHDKINVIFHCDGFCRDQPFCNATKSIIRGTRELIQIAKNIKNLKAFICLSTIYSNSDKTDIGEKVYESIIDPNKIIKMVEVLDEEYLSKLGNGITNGYPNSYAFVSQITEELLSKEAEAYNLPLAIVRSSTIISTAEEPIKALIQNVDGPTEIYSLVMKGLLRVISNKQENKLNLVPADYYVNNLIAAAWDVGTDRTTRNKKNSEVKVYNCVDFKKNLLTQTEFFKQCSYHGKSYSHLRSLWYPFLLLPENIHIFTFLFFMLQSIPQYIINFTKKYFGVNLRYFDDITRLEKTVDNFGYFSTKQRNFSNENVVTLWKKMSENDKKLFNFDIASLDWDIYFDYYVKGIRVYVLKDSMETLDKSVRKHTLLCIIHYLLYVVLIITLLLFFYFITLVCKTILVYLYNLF